MFRTFGAIICYFVMAACCGSAVCDKCIGKSHDDHSDEYRREMEDPLVDEEEVPGLVDPDVI